MAGVRIVLTRVDELDAPFMARAHGLGHDVAQIAVTTTRYRELDDVAKELDGRSYRTIVLTSRRAARYVPVVNRLPDATLACVGPTTRDAVKWDGRSIVADPANAATLSQLVIDAPLIWLAGSPHREDFISGIAARGLVCDIVEVYQTVSQVLTDDERAILSQADMVLCAAPSAWSAVSELVSPVSRVVALRASSIPPDVSNRQVVEQWDELLEGE